MDIDICTVSELLFNISNSKVRTSLLVTAVPFEFCLAVCMMWKHYDFRCEKFMESVDPHALVTGVGAW